MMADNPKDRGPADRARINVGQPHEVQYWTKELGVSEDELRRLVGEKGPMVTDVRAAIGK